MTHSTAIVVLLLLASSPLAAQNLIRNGNFDQGLTGWSTSGTATRILAPVSFDTVGTGRANPALVVDAARGQSAVLSQSVTVVAGLGMELTADLAVQGPKSNGGSLPDIQVSLGGRVVGSFSLSAFHQSYQRLTWRTQVCVRIAPGSVSGATTLRIDIANNTTKAGVGPSTFYLDDLDLHIAFDLMVYVQGDRFIGHAGPAITVLGQPDAAASVFIALKAGGPIVLPGIDGAITIDVNTAVPLFRATLDGSGIGQMIVTVPNNPSLVGMTLWLQGLQSSGASARPSLGPSRSFQIIS